MAEDKLNLMQRLAKIRDIADVVKKSKKGYGYTYADITDILAKVTSGMKKYGVSLIPSIVPGTLSVSQNVVTNTKTDKTGKTYDQTTTEMLVTAEMNFRWVNDENPEEHIDVPWILAGAQSDPSQAYGSGLTYTTRYFLTNYFNIAQSDLDVDAYRSKQREAEKSEDRAIAREIIEEFDRVVREYITGHPDSGENIRKFVAKYVKGGDYFSIHDPAVAAKLLEDFRNKINKGKEEKSN